MGQDLSDDLQRWLSSASQEDRSIVVLEISHPSMPATRYLWNEPKAGTVTLETGVQVQVLCCAFACETLGFDGTMDQVMPIALDTTDITDAFCADLDAIPDDSDVPPTVVFREYLDSDPDSVQSRVRLQAESIGMQRGKATISAALPRLNTNRTGEIYAPRDIPMLRGFQ